MLDIAASPADFTELAFLTCEAFAITQFGMDLHQLQAKVAAMGLFVDGGLQQFGSLVEAAVGDVDVGLADHVAGLRGHTLLGPCRNGFRLVGHSGIQLRTGERGEAVILQVEIVGEGVFVILRGQAVLQLGLFQGVAARQHHQQHQQGYQGTTACHQQKHRVGQHVVDDAGLRRLDHRRGRRGLYRLGGSGGFGRLRGLGGLCSGWCRRRRDRLRGSGRRSCGLYRSRGSGSSSLCRRRLSSGRLGRSGRSGSSRCLRCSWSGLCGGVCRLGRCCGSRRFSRSGRSLLALTGHVGLQLCELAVLELDQTLQLVHLALQVGHPALQFVVLATGRIQAFLGHRQLVAERLAFAVGALVASAGSLAAGGGYQSQAVLGFNLLGSVAGAAALGGVELALALPCQATALTPGGVLCLDLGNGLGLGTAGDLLFIGQAQYLAALQSIDIAVDEGIRVQVLDGQHCLVHRTTGTGALGDLPESVARGSAVFIGPRPGRGSRRCSRGTRTDSSWCCRCATDRGRGRSYSRTRRRSRRGDRDPRSHGSGSLGRIERRIEEQRVLTQQAAIGPEHLDEEIQIGFTDRLAGGHPNDAATIGLEDGGKLEVLQEVLAIHASLGEILGRSQVRLDLSRCQVTHFEQLDFRIQGLVQGRSQGDFPEPEGVGNTRSQRGCSRDCQHKFANPKHREIPLFLTYSRCAR
ncbi:hypothetical protein D9M68_418220 [compost metagenome]